MVEQVQAVLNTVLEMLNKEYLLYITGIGNLGWYYGWVYLLAILAAIVVVIIIVRAIKRTLSKKTRTKKNKQPKTKNGTPKAKPAVQTEKSLTPREKALADAPKITAYTDAEYPCGIDPLMYASDKSGSLSDQLKRQRVYEVWCEEQKKLRNEQIQARKEYFESNDFGFAVENNAVDPEQENNDATMTAAERKKYERIQRNNEKRIARAKRLRAKERVESKH